MSLFRTNQYQIISAVVNRITNDIAIAHMTNELHINNEDAIWRMGHQIVESLVDELCLEFDKDNRLFNETLFRTQCGNFISSKHVIAESIKSKMG